MRVWLVVACAAGCLWAVSGCVTTGTQGAAPEPGAPPRPGLILISPQQEAQLGASAFGELKSTRKISADAGKRAMVEGIVRRLAPHAQAGVAQWEVEIFEDATPNAFALPGGKIGVHTGLFPVAGGEAGLAAVIGHEIAHVALRHGGQRMTQQMGITLGSSVIDLALQNRESRERQAWMSAYGLGTTVFATLPYSRKHEYEADRMGLIYMAKAGYDPREAVGFWQRMQKAGGGTPPEFLSTHPADANRIAAIERLLPEALVFYQAPGAVPAGVR
ncbi:MAG: M48 family metallopeptidase [Verrucomicrobiae bacterium]|nr:M48 family metallopeptidase [Verrucomicrobiae bacterium]